MTRNKLSIVQRQSLRIKLVRKTRVRQALFVNILGFLSTYYKRTGRFSRDSEVNSTAVPYCTSLPSDGVVNCIYMSDAIWDTLRKMIGIIPSTQFKDRRNRLFPTRVWTDLAK